jgi:mevalonate kinase
MAETRAFGKLILFGEHLVVYKAPAIVGAVSAYTDCKLEYLSNSPGLLDVIDNRPAVPNYKIEKKEEGDEAIKLTLAHLGVDPNVRGVRLTFGGDLCCASGIGASAAQVVSLARAVNIADNRCMSDDEINAAGYEGEKGYHGTPSGIDNTAATFGGLLRFRRTDDAPIFEKITFPAPMRIVYASTGITASTTKVVTDVRMKKEADEVWFEDIMTRYTTIVGDAERAVEKGDLSQIGELMNTNHALLQELTVSCQELDDLVLAARDAGAIGAKMSGTGRGGLMIALTPTEEIQNSVAAALEKLAPQVWKTTFA